MRAENRKYHIIYKTTCLVNGKFYIGMHSTDNLLDGYMGSGKRIKYSLNKHGIENHVTEILEFVSSRQGLKLREAEIINEELLGEQLCMNIRLGGEGGFDHLSYEQRKNNALITNEKVRLRLLNDAEFENEYKQRSAERMKKTHADGKFEYGKSFKNKKHSSETKEQMSLKAKERIGDKNSQYGSCWINKDGSVKKIKKEELDHWIHEGWIKGRKIDSRD